MSDEKGESSLRMAKQFARFTNTVPDLSIDDTISHELYILFIATRVIINNIYTSVIKNNVYQIICHYLGTRAAQRGGWAMHQ